MAVDLDLGRVLLLPLCGVGLALLLWATFTLGRTPVGARPRWMLAGFGALALGLVLFVPWMRGAPLVPVSPDVLVKALGGALLVLAAGVSARGARVRLRADALRGTAPMPLDEAVEALRAGRSPGFGVYRGQLDSVDTLTSPGGVPCAFYDAAVHAVGTHGRKGPLLSRERAYSAVLLLKGERTRAAVGFAPSALLAPVEVRRCPAPPALTREELLGAPAQALSWERVGVPGEACLVVGELQRGSRDGTYALRGRGGRPALMVLGEGATGTGGELSRRAWRHFAAAGALSLAAVFMLARTL
ncbi:hypothetical protein D7W82_24015 [Corallococcus sp. CA049B]|uniref:hypothetical protein n=1 Tax=Corallococcus sp. CA049B TaxID=2316730 RepID=UPI000EA2CA78|nr:hypothetical protein [Corallococcus sp. CA049B]RKG83824.1 hypothetical protein D7W82_24015 [Corallococcus sp. CA049B]